MSYKLKKNLGERTIIRDKVYSILSKAIFQGKIKPGERLVESKLAKSFNISRTPIREAIIELEQKGLVVPSPPKGMKVAPVPTDFDIEKFYDVTKVLRSLSARMAVKNISYSQMEELKEIVKRSKNYFEIGDINGLVELNIKFHQIIENASRNEELIFLLSIHYKRLNERFSRIISNMKRQKEAIEEHQKILNAVENRDAELAEKLMCEHMENAKITLTREIKGEIPIRDNF